MSWILLVHILQLLRKQHVIITRSHGLPPDLARPPHHDVPVSGDPDADQPPVSGAGEADEVVLGAVDGVERADRQLTRAALQLAEMLCLKNCKRILTVGTQVQRNVIQG